MCNNINLKISVAAFTGGINVPSARFRVRQYIEDLNNYGISVAEFAAPFGKYPPRTKWLRPAWAVAALAARIPSVVSSYYYDLSLLQREMLSTLVTFEPIIKRPVILDVDDAIWLHSKGKSFEKIARSCVAVICGNTFLADEVSRWHNNVYLIPTAVDTNRYVPLFKHEGDITVGWSGTSGGFKYIYSIESALQKVMKIFPGSKLRIVSDAKPYFQLLDPSRVEYIKWTPENEVQAIQGMTVGIMPLLDSPWEQGKCSFKMLTYMACGVPVVVSPVGMNKDVLSRGEIGFGAKTEKDWVVALCTLLYDRNLCTNMGKVGREIILNEYSKNVISPRLAKIFSSTVFK